MPDKIFNFERVDLVKINIQGAEYEILTDPTLDLSNVYNMFIEVHYKYESQKSREIISALAKHGFRIIPLSRTNFNELSSTCKPTNGSLKDETGISILKLTLLHEVDSVLQLPNKVDK
jgi:hypothetical protein